MRDISYTDRVNIATYYDEDMNIIPTKGLLTTYLLIPSIPFDNEWIGVDGVLPVFTESVARQRPISATIEIMALDYLDYNLLREYLYGIFGFNKPFYIVDKRQPGKRYRVILESNFSPERHNPRNGTAVIPFITERLPYAESITTTQDIEHRGSIYTNELWGYELGITNFPKDLKYIHEGSSYEIYNAGNVPIHPFEQELKITISDVVGSTSFFELENKTNGRKFRVNEGVSNDKTVILDGPVVTSNGLQYLRKTNKGFIELDIGWNEFEISGASSAKVNYDFRFYYL